MKIIHKGIIFTPSFTDPYSSEYFSNFNHGPNLVKLNDGGCLAAWFSGPWEGHYLQRILLSRFSDGEWSPAETLQNTHGVADFDPAFVRTAEQIWFFYSNARWFEPKLHNQKQGFIATYFMYSDDEGLSWSNPALLSEKHACKGNGISLDDERILLPVYNTEENKVGVFQSMDNGKSWSIHETENTGVDIVEPGIIESEGRLVLLSRTNMGLLWFSESDNKGIRWTPPEPTNISCGNAPACITRIGKDLLICRNSGDNRRKLSVACIDSFDQELNQETIVDEVTPSQNTLIDSPIHPSESDASATYPSLLSFEKNRVMLAWSKYEISETEYKGTIHYCIVEHHHKK